MAATSLPESLTPAKRRNGHHAGRVVPLLGPQIDALYELRELVRKAQVEERVMTQEIVAAMQAAGLARLAGHEAVAVLDQRTTQRVDPERLHAAIGKAAFTAMTVSIIAARRLMGTDELAAISETTTSPVLRVQPVPPAAA